MPRVEKVNRAERIIDTLVGVPTDEDLEPGHFLIDTYKQMFEGGALTYVDWAARFSAEHARIYKKQIKEWKANKTGNVMERLSDDMPVMTEDHHDVHRLHSYTVAEEHDH